jgi:hypothetical protein
MPDRTARRLPGNRLPAATAAVNTNRYASVRFASIQLSSGASDHVIDSPVTSASRMKPSTAPTP